MGIGVGGDFSLRNEHIDGAYFTFLTVKRGLPMADEGFEGNTVKREKVCTSLCKRLTNTPVPGDVPVLKWLDDYRKEVGSAQATYAGRGS